MLNRYREKMATWRALVISLGISGAFDRSQHHPLPKTTEVPLNLRAQGISVTSLSAWVLVEFFGVFGEMGAWADL
jgi:hypothetical protein